MESTTQFCKASVAIPTILSETSKFAHPKAYDTHFLIFIFCIGTRCLKTLELAVKHGKTHAKVVLV